MKRMIRTILAVLAIVAGTVTRSGAQDKSVRFDPVGEDQYQLTYIYNGPVDLDIEVIDEKGLVLYTEHLHRRSSFMKPYSISELQSGVYTFKITDRDGVYVAQINKGEASQIEATITPMNTGKAQLLVKGNAIAPLSVLVYDKYNTLIYDDYIDHQTSFSKVYDFKDVRVGQLRIDVVSDTKVLATACL